MKRRSDKTAKTLNAEANQLAREINSQNSIISDIYAEYRKKKELQP